MRATGFQLASGQMEGLGASQEPTQRYVLGATEK